MAKLRSTPKKDIHSTVVENLKEIEDTKIERKTAITENFKRQYGNQGKDSINAAIAHELYSDETFDKIKAVINDTECSIRGIKYKQYGTRLMFYQGNTSNNWGVVELRENKTYFIRIMNSLLLKIFKTDERTKEIFERIL